MPICRALEPLRRVVAPAGTLLLLGGFAAAAALNDARAALLAGLPGAALLVLAALGRTPARRRVTSVLATSTAGFLALASAPGLAGIAEGAAGAIYQAACFVVAGTVLLIAWPAWRRANAVGEQARARRALYDEL
ncbi:MAG: hypothetical protein AAFZ65_04855 [Planctomycetota bacterium]